MSKPAAETFERIIDRHLLRGVMMPVPDYSPTCVVNEYNYAYFTHLGKVKAMNYSTSIFLINDEVRALYVIFQPDSDSNKQRRYMVKTFDESISEGDYVVTPWTEGLKLAIAKVTDTDVEVDFDSTTVVPWVVAKVDLSMFNEIVEQEDVAIAAIREAQFLERKEALAGTLLKSRKIAQLSLVKRKERGVDD